MNRPIARLFVVVLVMFGLLVVFTSRWSVFQATALRDNALNKRPALENLFVPRGEILADDNAVIARSTRARSGVYQRQYPFGSLFASPIGYYDPNNGASALERFRGDVLAGSPPQQSSIINQLSGKSTAGDTVLTTLDPHAQQVAYSGLAGRTGAVIALDPTTGAIRVFASNPTFDPNLVKNHADFQRLNTDSARQPLFDRVTQSQWAPGSTFKIVTAIAALDTGLFTPSSVLSGKSPITVATRPLANDGGISYGRVTLTYALTNSINTVYAQVAQRVGAARLQDYMDRLGFYRQPPIDLPSGELAVSGVRVPGHSGYLRLPQGADVGRVGIGEGGLEVTPLQMAMVASAVADGGRLMAPHLTREIVNPDGQVVERIRPQLYSRVMKPSTALAVNGMMQQVVKEGTGTAAALAGITVAGKTGTAQDCTNTAVCNTNQVWFIAFAPVVHPRIAIAVTLEHQVGVGGTVAAPIAKNVLQALLGSGA